MSLQLMLLYSQHCRPQWFKSCHFWTFKDTLRLRLWNGQRMSLKKRPTSSGPDGQKYYFSMVIYKGMFLTYGVMTEMASDNSTKLLFLKRNCSWIEYQIIIVIYPRSTSETLNRSAIIRNLMLTFCIQHLQTV